jgi:large subunit ribosomal protein L17
MRHRRKGRKLGRNPNHQRALLRNLASALFLTARDPELDDDRMLANDGSGKRPWRLIGDKGAAPKVRGRIVTTLPKAKEVRPLVEKCITIACKSLPAQRDADQYATTADRNTDEWKSWRNGDQWQKWNAAIAPVLNARRRVIKLLGDEQAARVLFEEVAADFEDRPGGYTRVLRLAKPRLGDAGTRAILELVGERDRVRQESEAPSFESEEPQAAVDSEPVAESEEEAQDETAEEEASDATADEEKKTDE